VCRRRRPQAKHVHGRQPLNIMGFSLTDIFVAGLLVLNGMAVLNEDRFLAKIGWGYEATRLEAASVKKQIVSLLHAVRLVFTIPLSASLRPRKAQGRCCSLSSAFNSRRSGTECGRHCVEAHPRIAGCRLVCTKIGY
jgi:hypothetical protein